MVKTRNINSTSVFSKKNVLNFYRGCTNNCLVCFNRSRCSGVKDFNEVGIKYRAPEVLEAALRHKRKKCMISVSNLADPYQKVEEEVKLFRSLLEIIKDKEFGVNIRTKNKLIYRDLELLDEMNYNSKVTVEVTLNSIDNNLAKVLEPNAASVEERIQLIKDLDDLNIPVLLRIKPILPFINDSEENLRGLIAIARDNNVSGIILDRFGVKINNSTRDYFFNRLSLVFPDIYQKYLDYFGTGFNYESPNILKLSEIIQNEVPSSILTDRREIFFFEKKYRNRKQGEQLRFF